MFSSYTDLTSEEAESNLKKVGSNSIPEKRTRLLSKLFKIFFSPISLMLFLASFLSFLSGDNFDAYFILVLVAINLFITLWQEGKADNAVKILNQKLEQGVTVLRDKEWRVLSSSVLVPGDVIKLKSGEIVPADVDLLEANNVSVNESVLTGESLPVEKESSESAYSGSFVVRGIAIAKVIKTGGNTKFGKTVISVEKVNKKSLLERDIIKISEFLTIISLTAVCISSTVFLLQKASAIDLLKIDLSIIIAGVPISLPTVMTLITELGVFSMAKKHVIVRRISSLEDLSNVNYLLTDKTGTLTKNKIGVSSIYACKGFSVNDVLTFSSYNSNYSEDDPIGMAIIDKTNLEGITPVPLTKSETFIPADSERKRSTLFVNLNGDKYVISLGATQVVEYLCNMELEEKQLFETEVKKYAERGDRALALAVSPGSDKEENMKMVGLIALSDEVRDEAGSVVSFLKDYGIEISVVTGDNRAIASKVVEQISPGHRKVVTKEELDATNLQEVGADYFYETEAFAEVFPEDKLRLVEKAKEFFIVAANGDGINDLPAIKAANVGIAVSNAVGALKSVADIVLLSEGIGVVKNAVIESRKIFERVYTYSIYRISESFRLVVSLAIIGILYNEYPLTPVQIILLALLNDLPIISLAFDRVKIPRKPERLNLKKQVFTSSLFGVVGILNSLLLLVVALHFLDLDWSTVQTLFFLKLTVSGHLLIFVAHTDERWFKFLPSKEVIFATITTQLLATGVVMTGVFMPANLSLSEVIFVWLWAFIWMQITEIVKIFQKKFSGMT